MSVRTRAAASVQVGKGYGPGIPPAIEAAEHRARMTPQSPFSPGTPIGPYEGFSRQPRAQEYQTGYNIATRPRLHERVSFEVLKGLIGAYDVADLCIWHRIDSVRSLDWKLVAADQRNGDVSEAIAVGMAAMEKPDRVHYYETWIGKWLYDVLAYDAGCLYRLRNRAGRCIGLLPVDGTTIAPLLDYWGNPPGAMAAPGEVLPESHVQYVNGLPWNWLTRADLIYEPYRMHNDSPYGRAPIESIILNANTDVRFQLHFLQRFTEGNIPEAFASAPETWGPQQIEMWQELWDGLMYGDQSRKHQIRWMPGGSKIVWSNEKDFTDTFSLFLMRKTAAAYHVVPADLGFTENVNRSSGESQADVQHRVGDLPFIRYIARIITGFLQNDLGLPIKFQFDLGEEQADRIAQAQADKIYIELGAVGASEIREMRYGLTDAQPVPRFVFTQRSGPIPLSALFAVAGPTDSETSGPDPGAPLPRKAFGAVEGVLPNPPVKVPGLAVQRFGPDANPDDPAIPPAPAAPGQPAPGAPVAKEGEAPGASSAAGGITADTGIWGYDLAGVTFDDIDDDDEELEPGEVRKRYMTFDEARQAYRDGVADGRISPEIAALVEAKMAADREAEQAEVVKELRTFRRFAARRRKEGQWSDFLFLRVPAADAARLNAEGRAEVRKAASGYELSPRSGMISLDLPDGTVPAVVGGVDDHHVTVVYLGPDVDDDMFATACQRAAQAAALVPGPLQATVSGVGAFPPSDSSEGRVPAWASVSIPGAQDLRDALEDLSASQHPGWTPHVTLAYLDPGDPLPAPLEPVPVTFTRLSVHRGDEVAQFALGGGEPVAKLAGGARPKARDWHGWKLDEKTARHWAPVARRAVAWSLPRAKARDLGRDYLAGHPGQDGKAPGKRDRNAAAAAWILAWLARQRITLVPSQVGEAIAIDGYAIGSVSAKVAVTGGRAGKQTPGDQDSALRLIEEAGLAAELALLLHGGNGATPAAEAVAEALARGYANALAVILAGADADWAQEQEALDELGALLSSALADEDLAVTLVGTQINIYTGLSAYEYYMANSVTEMNWVTDPSKGNVCPVCLQNEGDSPQPNGQPWPSGDLRPPAHPHCNCALLPAWL